MKLVGIAALVVVLVAGCMDGLSHFDYYLGKIPACPEDRVSFYYVEGATVDDEKDAWLAFHARGWDDIQRAEPSRNAWRIEARCDLPPRGDAS